MFSVTSGNVAANTPRPDLGFVIHYPAISHTVYVNPSSSMLLAGYRTYNLGQHRPTRQHRTSISHRLALLSAIHSLSCARGKRLNFSHLDQGYSSTPKVFIAMQKPSIRLLRTADAKEKDNVVALVNRCYRSKGNWTTECHLVHGPRVTISELERDLKSSIVLVAALPCELVVGCVKVRISRRNLVLDLPSAAGTIGLFAVHPDFGGQGLGSQLLAAAERHCISQDVHTAVLEVLNVREDILAYYERRGYARIPGASTCAVPIFNDGVSELLVSGMRFILLRKELLRKTANVETLQC